MGTWRVLRAREERSEERPVNPPYREPARPPEPEERPRAIAVEEPMLEEPAPVEPPRAEPEAPDPGETAPPGAPEPVRVPYARTGAEPDVVAAPTTRPPARRAGRSPFWAAVRSHVWLVSIVLVLVGAAGTAYWGLRVHQRISQATLERDIGNREHASAVRCVEQQSNGAVWACGLVYQASSVCLIANVSPVGDWNTNDGPGLCDRRPELAAILPARITASAVASDLASQQGTPGMQCAKLPEHKVRWACLGSTAGGSCLLVRIAPWSSLATEQSTVCDHVPALRKAHGKA